VDLSFGALPFEKEAIARRRWVEVGGVNVPLPRPEDLIVMKAIANRTRDKADIEAILDTHPKLDLRHVRRYVKEFASTLEMPEILSDFEAAVAKRHRKKKRPASR
jgi:predicted nucleotidyltransferase